mmetsp:Transcript_16064/g.27103  ORF Transcript_16064/g.27103 Transcript_16064/m.27103 type:complete len:389 (+) Transcript_16064:368-1534(+)
MLDHARPVKWADPPEQKGEEKYDLVVIGAGAGGLVTAIGSQMLGAKCCLIERGYFGGDCLVTGCVPSKAFIRAASVAHTLKNSEQFGISIKGEVDIDFGRVMTKMREIRAEISEADSPKKFAEKYGVDIFLGNGQFVDPHTIQVNGRKLKFNKACIATGGKPLIPEIKGRDEVKFYSSDNIFNLTRQPKEMLIIGSGPIGCELGQSFQRLGTNVTMFSRGNTLLPQEDPESVKLLQAQMEEDGVHFMFETHALELKNLGRAAEGGEDDPDQVKVTFKRRGEVEEKVFDLIMLATGRSPNVQGLNCEGGGVKYSSTHGIEVDKHLRTSNSNVFAVGDCIPGLKFTHNSDMQARCVMRNALFFGKMEYMKQLVPYCTYTEPEIARVGMTE